MSHGTKYIVLYNNSCRCFLRLYLFTVHKEPVYINFHNLERFTVHFNPGILISKLIIFIK